MAVEEALRLGVTDAVAVLHILNMPDPEQRRSYAIALACELAAFERPMPVMDEYDLLLKGTPGGGCKTVIGSRLKQSGMFWTVRGANAIIALRCTRLSGKFEDYWASRSAAA